jgi:hypothetical protein
MSWREAWMSLMRLGSMVLRVSKNSLLGSCKMAREGNLKMQTPYYDLAKKYQLTQPETPEPDSIEKDFLDSFIEDNALNDITRPEDDETRYSEYRKY